MTFPFPVVGVSGCNCTPAYVTGDRTASITVTASATLYDGAGAPANLVNGNLTQDASNSLFDSAADAVSGLEFRFQFSGSTKIKEAKFYGEAFSHGTWKWQGSNNGTDWVDLSANFTLTCSVAGTTDTSLSGNTNGYTYYRMLGVSGNMSANRWITEIEFSQCAC